MRRQRVEAQDGAMFTSYEITKAVVSHRQQEAFGHAHRHRLARLARRAQRKASVVAEHPSARLYLLPARTPAPGAHEERVAS
jgi:hypothetical protein